MSKRIHFMIELQVQASFLVPVTLDNPPSSWYARTMKLSQLAKAKLLKHTSPYRDCIFSDFHIVKEESCDHEQS